MPVLGPVVVGQVYRVSLFQVLYGQRVLNTLYYKLTEVPGVDPPDIWEYMESLADFCAGAGNIVSKMALAQTDDLEHREIRIQKADIPGDLVTPYFSLENVVAGAFAAAAGTANVAASIEKRSLFEEGHPQQGIGRLQLGGIPQTQYVAGEWDAGYVPLLQDVADEMEQSIVTAGVTAVPVNFGWDYTNPDDPPTGYHAYEIFQCLVKDTVRIMRRRTVRVGE